MPDGIPGRLVCRVLDANRGTVVIPRLKIAGGGFTVRAVGQSNGTPGDFNFELPAPGTAEFDNVRQDLLKLARGQRVEVFEGDEVAGPPTFSGIITKAPARPLERPWSISGDDTMWLLERSRLFVGEPMGQGGDAALLVEQLAGSRIPIWDDDFANWNGGASPPHNSSDYAATSITFTAADPQFGQPAIGGTTSGMFAVTATSWASSAQYNLPASPPQSFAASMVTAQGTMIAGTSTTYAASAEVLALANGTIADYILGRAIMRQIGATGTYGVDAEIWTSSAGTPTVRTVVTDVLTPGLGSTLPFEVSLVLYSLGNQLVARLLVNGRDPNCTYSTAAGFGVTPGRVGVRSAWNAGGSPTVWFNRLKFESRERSSWSGWATKRFALGTITHNKVVQNTIWSTGQSHLEMMMLASTLDGHELRKTSGFGHKADTLDYGPAVGADLSSSVVFREGDNIEGASVEPTADPYATAERVNAVPGNDSGGSFTYSPVAQDGASNPDNADMVLLDTVADIGVPGYTLLASYARAVAMFTADPLQAVELVIRRTSKTSGRWRELDNVLVDVPTIGVYNQTLQVVGYTYVVGSAEQRIWVNQFPAHRLIEARVARINRFSRFVSNTYQQR